MSQSIRKKSLIFTIFTVFVGLIVWVLPAVVSAQTGPDFEITSSKNITAIAGESFTYFVVTKNDTEFRLQSELPTGMNFSGNRISGTPEETGTFELEFVASNDSGAAMQTVTLEVVSGSSGPASGSQVAAAGQSEGSVRLNEVPETGLSADQALTVGFYLLAILLVSVTAVTRFTPSFATAGSEEGGTDVADVPRPNQSVTNDRVS